MFFLIESIVTHSFIDTRLLRLQKIILFRKVLGF